MKNIGLIILVGGLLVTIFTSFNFETKKKVVEIGKLEITKDESHSISWSPLIGLAIMVGGGTIFLYGSKKK